MLVLCSAKSVQRPWINFETGFGSARGVEVIPVCYAGQDKGQLPAPLSFYQGLNLRDAGVLELLLEQIAEKVNMHCPQADCAALAERIGKIEERYMFWDACNAAFDGLEACMPGIMQTLKQLPVGGTYEFEVEGTEENQIFKKLREGFFADGSILALSEAEGMTIYADYEVSKDYICNPQRVLFGGSGRAEAGRTAGRHRTGIPYRQPYAVVFAHLAEYREEFLRRRGARCIGARERAGSAQGR